ncbi:MAG TPA: hypothetical protein V6D09_05210 [Leptolyngbyaceae cyanobacterium]
MLILTMYLLHKRNFTQVAGKLNRIFSDRTGVLDSYTRQDKSMNESAAKLLPEGEA